MNQLLIKEFSMFRKGWVVMTQTVCIPFGEDLQVVGNPSPPQMMSVVAARRHLELKLAPSRNEVEIFDITIDPSGKGHKLVVCSTTSSMLKEDRVTVITYQSDTVRLIYKALAFIGETGKCSLRMNTKLELSYSFFHGSRNQSPDEGQSS